MWLSRKPPCVEVSRPRHCFLELRRTRKSTIDRPRPGRGFPRCPHVTLRCSSAAYEQLPYGEPLEFLGMGADAAMADEVTVMPFLGLDPAGVGLMGDFGGNVYQPEVEDALPKRRLVLRLSTGTRVTGLDRKIQTENESRPAGRHPVKIKRIHVYQALLPVLGDAFRMSHVTLDELDSTLVEIVTDDGRSGWGETCPLGSVYQPHHALGVRAGLEQIAPASSARRSPHPADSRSRWTRY